MEPHAHISPKEFVSVEAELQMYALEANFRSLLHLDWGYQHCGSLGSRNT